MKTPSPHERVDAALLDVNVLIALIDPAHEFHEAAHEWFGRNRQHGWATCPMTENACLRILSKPAYPWVGLTVDAIRRILAELCASDDHRFWPDSVSMLDGTRFDIAQAAPKNLTDIYLLGVAKAHGGRSVTFVRGIRWECVNTAVADSIELL